jgi:hypothetical protein
MLVFSFGFLLLLRVLLFLDVSREKRFTWGWLSKERFSDRQLTEEREVYTRQLPRAFAKAKQGQPVKADWDIEAEILACTQKDCLSATR